MLAYGTLIGTIRHKGFIPWDDDVDVIMTRKNYNKFCNVCKTELNPIYTLETIDTNPAYSQLMAKVCLRGTSMVSVYDGDAGYGIWTDIFVCDTAPKFYLQKLGHKIILKWLKAGYNARLQVGLAHSPVKRALRYVTTMPLRMFSDKKIRSIISYQMQKYNRKETGMLVETCSPSYWRNLFRKEALEDLTEAAFEGYLFSIPKAYDEVLRVTYNNYLILPPEEEQRGHELLDFDFGEYTSQDIILNKIQELYGLPDSPVVE